MHHDGVAATCLALVLLASPAPASPGGSALFLTPADAHTVETARQGALRRLRSPECRKVLADFRDAQGRSLDDRLAAFALAPDEYLRRVAFLDGSRRPLCQQRQAELLTTPGAARVLVCPEFLKTVWRNRTQAEGYVIHEMLHTLGLGEDPPTSRQITIRVEERCAP